MEGAVLPPTLPAAWYRWRSSLAALAGGAPDGGRLDEAWAALQLAMREASGHTQAVWDVMSRWVVCQVGEAWLLHATASAALPRPRSRLPLTTPCSSLPAVLEDLHALCTAACQRAELRAPALTALQLLPVFPMLPIGEGSSPERVPAIVSSKPYAELSRFLLRRGPALLRRAVAEVVAPARGARTGTADALAWAADLGSKLLVATPLLLWPQLDGLLPAKLLKRGVASCLDAAAEAWEARVQGKTTYCYAVAWKRFSLSVCHRSLDGPLHLLCAILGLC